MTSLNIIREVMNVPQCALNSILRDNGYTEVEPGSICIDEKMLSVFADEINEKVYDELGDVILEIEDGKPVLVEEYLDDINNMLT